MKITQEILDLLYQINHLDTISDLSHLKIESVHNDKICVSYAGHQVGGSYVHDWQVAPQYVLDIEYTTNRKTVWTKRDSTTGGFGSDRYYFDIFYNKIVDKKKYKPEGTLWRVNAHRAFSRDTKHEWCLLLILHEFIMRNPGGYADLDINNTWILFKGERVAKIVQYNKPRSYVDHGHNVSSGRTHWDAIYDYVHETNEVRLMYEIMTHIMNVHLKKAKLKTRCTWVAERPMPNTGDKLIFQFSNDKVYIGGSNYKIPDPKEIRTILNGAYSKEHYRKITERRNMFGQLIPCY